MRETSFEVPLGERWGEGLVAYPAGSTLSIDARLESVHEGILVTADIDGTYEGECGRCLTEISSSVEVEFQELFAYPGKEAEDLEVQDDHVDLETPVRDAMVLALPFQPVCRPDCPGLDPETGKLRAPGTVSDAGPVDPRWSALADLAGAEGPQDSDTAR